MDILMIILKWYSVLILCCTLYNSFRYSITESTIEERRRYFSVGIICIPVIIYLLIK